MAIKVGNFFKQQLEDAPQDIDLDAPKKPGAKPGMKQALKKLSDYKEKLNISTEFCLITELHCTMSGHDPDRPYTRLHASDVTNQDIEFCPRERALLIATKAEKNTRYISTETRTYFDVGECYHDLVREKWGANVSFGNWLCLACLHVAEASYKPDECPKCSSKYLRYEELRVKSADTSISCGIDWQVFHHKLDQAIPYEIKSINADEFKKLVAPHAEHRIRTKLYLHSIANPTKPEKVNHLRTDVAGIIYVSKGAPDEGEYLGGSGFKEKKTPFKEYMIQRDDAEIEDYLNKGRQLKRFLEGGPLPEKICKASSEKRAEACRMCAQCWSKN
ncbi:rubredoxin-type fold protein [Vibrio phage vB_ValS_PJ32]|nr:rubredoxin-type fold protein [Vibrio phage vB_ValS_PJ32]